MKKLVYCVTALLLLSMAAPRTAGATAAETLLEQLHSEAAVLMDADTGQVLLEKNMHRRLSPASITKIMTGLLALEVGELSDTLTLSHDAVFSVGRDTAHIALDVGEEITLREALYALAIASANDAANGIAEHLGGSLEGFAGLMNERARAAGALNTHFTNAHGLPDEEHTTTAYDMARITRAALETPGFTDFFSAETHTMPPTNKQPEARIFRTRNAMIAGDYQYDGVIMGKTGWTTAAQHTLVTAATRAGRTLIVVVMKSSKSTDKWEDTTALLDFGFGAFESVTFAAEELAAEGIVVLDAVGEEVTVSLTAGEDFTCLLPVSMNREAVEIRYAPGPGFTRERPDVWAVFTLKPAYQSLMYPQLGSMALSATPEEPEEVEAFGESELPGEEDGLSGDPGGWPVVLFWITGIVGVLVLFIAVLYIRRALILRRRRRNRALRYQQRR